MSYVLCKPMKVQVAPGKLEQRQAGDPIPEAASWANPAIWIKRGFIRPTTQEAAAESGYSRAKLQPMRPAKDADAIRGTGAPIPRAGKPLPGYKGLSDSKPAEGAIEVPTLEEVIAAGYSERIATSIVARQQALADGASEAEVDVVVQAAFEEWDLAHPDGGDQDGVKADLMSMTRTDMDALATEHGVAKAEGYPNKSELADAIMKATAKA